MGCGISLPSAIKRNDKKKIREGHVHSIPHEMVQQFDQFQLEHPGRHNSSPTRSQENIFQSAMMVIASLSKNTTQDPRTTPQTIHKQDRMSPQKTDLQTLSYRKSIPNGESKLLDRCSTLTMQVKGNDSASENDYDNILNSFTGLSLKPIEDMMFNFLSRRDKVLVQDLESLLCTSCVEIHSNEKHGWKHAPEGNDKLFDIIIVLLTEDENNRKRKFLVFAHRAVLAARSTFFSSKIGTVSHQLLVSNINPLESSNYINVRQSLPERMTKLMNSNCTIDLEFELPIVVRNPDSFLILLEYIYTGLFRPEFGAKFKNWVEQNNLEMLIEVLTLAHYFSVPQLKNCAMFHMCDLVEKNLQDYSEFKSFMTALCPSIPFSNLKREVKVCLDVEHVFNEHRKVKRKCFYSPMQSKKQLEKDFEKMYIQSNTSSMTNLSLADYTDIKLSVALPKPATSGARGSMQFGPRLSSRKLFRVHKSILNARSQYFKEYFRSERLSDVVDMPSNLSFPVLKAFVHYLYTDTIREELESILPELLPLAIDYGVPGLKALCLKSFYDRLTEDNIFEELRIQNENSNYQLTELCLYKMAYMYPRIIDQFARKSPFGSTPEEKYFRELRESVPLLHLRTQYQLIWNRRIFKSVTLEQLLPRRQPRSKHGQQTKLVKIAVIGAVGSGRSTMVKEIKSFFPNDDPYFPNRSFGLEIPTPSSRDLDASNDDKKNKKATGDATMDTVIPIEIRAEVLDQNAILNKQLDAYDGVLLLFSLNDLASLHQATKLHELIMHHSSAGEKPMTLVGNKVDLQAETMVEQCMNASAFVNALQAVQFGQTTQIALPRDQCHRRNEHKRGHSHDYQGSSHCGTIESNESNKNSVNE